LAAARWQVALCRANPYQRTRQEDRGPSSLPESRYGRRGHPSGPVARLRVWVSRWTFGHRQRRAAHPTQQRAHRAAPTYSVSDRPPPIQATSTTASQPAANVLRIGRSSDSIEIARGSQQQYRCRRDHPTMSHLVPIVTKAYRPRHSPHGTAHLCLYIGGQTMSLLGVLAPRVQAGLQRFAKPWWKRRARDSSLFG
jgi:hypothetical protein